MGKRADGRKIYNFAFFIKDIEKFDEKRKKKYPNKSRTQVIELLIKKVKI